MLSDQRALIAIQSAMYPHGSCGGIQLDDPFDCQRHRAPPVWGCEASRSTERCREVRWLVFDLSSAERRECRQRPDEAGGVSEEFPTFDDDWVASARHHEASVAELQGLRRSERRHARRARRRRLIRHGVGIMLAIGCLAGFAWYVVEANGWSHDAVAVDRGHGMRFASVTNDRPTPMSAASRRLLPAVGPVDPSASYAFVALRPDGSPVRYDPCRPVRFVVNPTNAPPEYLGIIADVFSLASEATGLRLELVDATTEPPVIDRAVYQPARYGDKWPPVLIAWTSEAVVSELRGDVAGVGGSTRVSGGDSATEWFVSGVLYLDSELGSDRQRNEIVMLHELGHVLGLDHVNDPAQIMNPTATASELGDGDRAGLAALGAGECAGFI